MRFATGQDLPERRFDYRKFFQRAQALATRAGLDFNGMVHRHSVKRGRSHNIQMMTARDLRHWPKWITRKLMKKGVAV